MTCGVVGRATSSLERTLTKLQNELAELAQDTNIQMETIQRDMKAQVGTTLPPR